MWGERLKRWHILDPGPGRFRPPRDRLAPYRFRQDVILDAGQVLLDFAGSVQQVYSVGKCVRVFMRELRCLTDAA
jgi:hypothetical protein